MKPRHVMRTVRYSRGWKRGTTTVESSDVIIRREGRAIPATFVRPARAQGPLPCWIAIGGVSLKGRFHPQLVRFTEALASTGVGVLVPGLPEWRQLSVCPRVIRPTIRASIEYLNSREDTLPGGFGVIGFSFGATGAMLAASDKDLLEHVRGAVVFGGYCCLTRTLDCMLTGDHEWEDQRHRLEPDPYGRWVVASNYLTRIPGYEDAADVAIAVKRLATEASSRRISAWEPYHDPMITALRQSIASPRRALFDVLATPTTGQVIHGRGDRVVPFTEATRLMDRLPANLQRGVTVTGMINHSKDRVPPTPLEHAREAARLFRALHQLVNTI